ncbi:MAG: ABC transporter permease [Candidatus Babeliales bacterium]
MNRLREFFLQEQKFFWTLPALLWQILFLCMPFLFVLGVSFISVTDTESLSFTLAHYKALALPVYAYIILRSLVLALTTATLCLCIGYPVSYYLAFYVKRWKNPLLFLLILPFWTNILVQVYAWFFILEKEGIINNVLRGLGIIQQPLALLNSIFAIAIVMLYCFLPFMIFPIYTVLEKMDRTLIEASKDLGATTFQTWRRVVLPLSMPGIKTGFFLVFVPAFGEFVIPLLMGGDKYFFVGGLISYEVLIARDWPFAAAFTVVACLVLLIALYSINRLLSRSTRLVYGGSK